MKVILVTLLVVALSYKVSAMSLESRAYTCPGLMQFYDEVVQCAAEIQGIRTPAALCKEFTAGGCQGITQIYANDCGKNYGNDPIYRQLSSTMKDVKSLCF